MTGFLAKEVTAIWDKLQINTLQWPWWAFFPSQGHWPWGSNSSVDKASSTERALVAGTREEEQPRRSTAHSNNDITRADLCQHKMQQHAGLKSCIPTNSEQKQQAYQEPEGNQVTQGYPFIACYFWTAHVQFLTLETPLQALFKVHLKRNGTFNQAPQCRNKRGILTIVIQLIIHT